MKKILKILMMKLLLLDINENEDDEIQTIQIDTVADSDRLISDIKKFKLDVKVQLPSGDIYTYTKGILTLHQYSNGYWEKWTHDVNGNNILYEDSEGSWDSMEYDSEGSLHKHRYLKWYRLMNLIK